MKCNKCQSDILLKDPNYCPYCGSKDLMTEALPKKNIEEKEKPQSKFTLRKYYGSDEDGKHVLSGVFIGNDTFNVYFTERRIVAAHVTNTNVFGSSFLPLLGAKKIFLEEDLRNEERRAIKMTFDEIIDSDIKNFAVEYTDLQVFRVSSSFWGGTNLEITSPDFVGKIGIPYKELDYIKPITRFVEEQMQKKDRK